MKKNDWILAGVLVAAALCIYLFQFFNRKEGSLAVVSVDGADTQTYALSEERSVEIKSGEGSLTLEISGGEAFVSEADCPDKLCVRQHPVSHRGETIACLPNRILIRIEGGSSSGYDAIAD